MTTATTDYLHTLQVTDLTLIEKLLAIADTKLILGNWHTICLLNGKSLPDYSALLAMSAASFGHARALYEYISRHGIDYTFLERGRNASQIHSSTILDTPPKNWQDLIVSSYLTELSIWSYAEKLLTHSDQSLAALIRRIGEETYFHLKYSTGWAKEFVHDPLHSKQAQQAFSERLDKALVWFPNGSSDAATITSRTTFTEGVNQLAQILNLPEPGNHTSIPEKHAGTNPVLRQFPLPARLFEKIQFKDPDAAP